MGKARSRAASLPPSYATTGVTTLVRPPLSRKTTQAEAAQTFVSARAQPMILAEAGLRRSAVCTPAQFAPGGSALLHILVIAKFMHTFNGLVRTASPYGAMQQEIYSVVMGRATQAP
jgi:hypothetical protein